MRLLLDQITQLLVFEALTQYNATQATALGARALKEAGGTNNIGIGPNTGFNLNGSSNILIGQNAGYYGYNSRNNVVVGNGSFNGTSGNLVECTVLGYQACTGSNQSGQNNTIIGHDAQPSTTSVQNEITLGNSFYCNFKMSSYINYCSIRR